MTTSPSLPPAIAQAFSQLRAFLATEQEALTHDLGPEDPGPAAYGEQIALIDAALAKGVCRSNRGSRGKIKPHRGQRTVSEQGLRP